ncbi:hypothetical protein B0T25DRAFT_546283 [Lasiosphaeria hispida]|uniref:Uncharacterized protein n=1 Tax=Lasiosphaeria hispida TaxID=260671 RepID=A0AAJ0HD97_9PEZI|nr:hypothetical protein B0T25DRAFT_546283 [Lasiosphaeria hispida]
MSTTSSASGTPNRPGDLQAPWIRGAEMQYDIEEVAPGRILMRSLNFISTHILRRRAAEVRGQVSPVSRRLGMPVVLVQNGRDVPVGTVPAGTNVAATLLMTEIRPENGGWGYSSAPWVGDVGNVVVVREDGKDLEIEDLRLMALFLLQRVKPKMIGALSAGSVSLAKKREVLKFITRENMLKFKDELHASGNPGVSYAGMGESNSASFIRGICGFVLFFYLVYMFAGATACKAVVKAYLVCFCIVTFYNCYPVLAFMMFRNR